MIIVRFIYVDYINNMKMLNNTICSIQIDLNIFFGFSIFRQIIAEYFTNLLNKLFHKIRFGLVKK